MKDKLELAWAFAALSRAQGVSVDVLRMESAFATFSNDLTDDEGLQNLCARIGFTPPARANTVDPAQLPLLHKSSKLGWGLILNRRADGAWLFRHESGEEWLAVLDRDSATYRTRPLANEHDTDHQTFAGQVKSAMRRHRATLIEAGLATVVVNMLALAVSLFSMQVYDRVIPTGAAGTLFVLLSGVALVLVLDLVIKFARSRIMDAVTMGVDESLSRSIFQRLLAVRVDQFPGSVGSLAAQLRGYESIRAFYTTTTLFALIDLPMGLIFVSLMAWIGHVYVALVPLLVGSIALLVGLSGRKKLIDLAQSGMTSSNKKMGLLVEAVEGVETIKAGSGGWKFLSRWLDINTQSMVDDLRLRHTNESITYITGFLHQVAYTGTVSVGALVVVQGDMTMGSLIACSILSGRVLQPVMQIPSILSQHANAKAALEGLEKVYQLETDHPGVPRPLLPSRIQGNYALKEVAFGYPGGGPALQIAGLRIRQGERVGVLGPIGSGKSTLLRLLSGLYRAQMGQITLDNMDLQQIDRTVLAHHIGYLQQEHRLFQGTLRENLLVGMPDPGDDAIQLALEKSGMIAMVIAHPRGLELPIYEGGKGLSGGQKQLVAFTRLLLCQPEVWLLDEPTASMDGAQETLCLKALGDATRDKTVVIVTHKPSILPLVDRLIVIAGGKIVMDDSKHSVLERLSKGEVHVPRTSPDSSGPMHEEVVA